ncbi:MAG TPA: type II toxin-antitoxin system death-on-curing family toxin [Nocardioides sp.]|uniref:type II toxin-antitoxin system death-on-curing family toxin n=1 Tax=Nocardioides sp. TaxID=35761 RepID=UPI002E31DBA4|nr:type II toxin-antitoxin system death-on-curing family toxin [Nocardioides sp.]HEX5089313.1 type II toxin-antitoxin system death-on-curing family toxin [Nocardioides sp.]
MIYLDLDDLLHIAERVLGRPPEIRDLGLLDAAAARPRTTVYSQDAYPTLETKVAALLHSVTRNHALVDGNKRLGLASTIAFLGLNGHRLTLTNDDAYELVMAVSTGVLDEVSEIADRISAAIEPWDEG